MKTYGVDKSLDLDSLIDILKLDQFCFINLQYGDTANEIYKFKKYQILK